MVENASLTHRGTWVQSLAWLGFLSSEVKLQIMPSACCGNCFGKVALNPPAKKASTCNTSMAQYINGSFVLFSLLFVLFILFC